MTECTERAEDLQVRSLKNSTDSDLERSTFLKVFCTGILVGESEVSLLFNKKKRIPSQQKCLSLRVIPDDNKTYEGACKKGPEKIANSDNLIDCAAKENDDLRSEKSIYQPDQSQNSTHKKKPNKQAKHQPFITILCFVMTVLATVSGKSLVSYEYWAIKGESLNIRWNGSWDDIVFINGMPIGHCNGHSDCVYYNPTFKKDLELKNIGHRLYELEIYHVKCCINFLSVKPTGRSKQCKAATINVCGCEEQGTKYDAPPETCPFEMEKTMSETSGCLEDLIPSVDCGGTVTNESGSISYSGVNQTMLCIWVIQVAAGYSDKPNIINASLAMTGSRSTDNNLEVRDGASVCSLEYTPQLNRTILSRTNILWIRYSYVAKKNTSPLNFTLNYSIYACDTLCNNSLCMHPDWRCNGKNDCGDWSDELDCCALIPPSHDTKSTNAGLYIFVGMVLGAMIVLMPRCIRYIRARSTVLETEDTESGRSVEMQSLREKNVGGSLVVVTSLINKVPNLVGMRREASQWT